MEDFDEKILPGLVHWQHPNFHAYFPAANSYPSILGHMLGDILGVVGFSWASSPACTELEFLMMDWVAKALGLPNQFLFHNNGGGCIQNTASDCILAVIIAARHRTLLRLGKCNSFIIENISRIFFKYLKIMNMTKH